MSKSSVLAVLALIVGASGVGLGAYQILLVTPSQSGIKNTWYSFDKDSHYAGQAPLDIAIDSLLIIFSVSSGESVYLHFNTMLHVPGSVSFIFNFVVDSVILLGSLYPDWIIEQTNSTLAVSLQLSLDSVSAGVHNVTIGIYSRDAVNYISSSSLLVQTYIH